MGKCSGVGYLFFFFLLGCGSLLQAQEGTLVPRRLRDAEVRIPKTTKGATVVPGPFRVTSVRFETVSINNVTYLATAVVFNRNVDATSVRPNFNIRLLRQNENYFWVDHSTQNNKVNVRPNFITWVSGAPLQGGVYKMHLRGTIKSADGVYLDCNGDGKGEGGNLPPYESQPYQANIIQLVPAEQP